MTALIAVACISATLLMIELALTRIFSVVMYYHFAFLAISIALFGLSASGVYAFLRRDAHRRRSADSLLSRQALVYAACTIASLFALVRLRVGLTYSPANLALMLTIYALAALPFFTGGLIITLAISRSASRINSVYAADLTGAAAGCLLLIPLLNLLGAPGVILTAAALAVVAATLFASSADRQRIAGIGTVLLAVPLAGQLSGVAGFDVLDTKGHQGDRVLFNKWNSFSRVAVYDRSHGDWSLSPAYHGPLPETRFMDIDSAASTPIPRVAPDLSNVQYLRYELTALAYQLITGQGSGLTAQGSGLTAQGSGLTAQGSELPAQRGFSALVIGPGGGRDLVSALVFGASRVDGVEINPIIADDVMRGAFEEFSGHVYSNPRVRIFVDDGRSFVRRTPDRYDIIQASLVDTWAATAAGAYTLTENSLYTVEAFDDYLDHLTDDGMLTITRWVFDGLRLVSLAQEACEKRGWDARSRLAIVRHDRVATFLLKRSPFTPEEIAQLRQEAERLGFDVLYAPADGTPSSASTVPPVQEVVGGTSTGDYARLITSTDRETFYRTFKQDIRPTTDDRPFFFHTTKLADQFQVAFGRSMLFGNGLSALLALMAISLALVVSFVIGPLVLAGGGHGSAGWWQWLVYFGSLGSGFMLFEVAVLQRFVLLLGHPVYSLTVTLFSLLFGTGLGAAWSRRFAGPHLKRRALLALGAIALIAAISALALAPMVNWAVPFSRPVRMLIAVATLVPIGMVLGIPMPAGIQLLRLRDPELVTWAWGMNGALSVVGATTAIFVAMNWGFNVTLLSAGAIYLLALAALALAARPAVSLKP